MRKYIIAVAVLVMLAGCAGCAGFQIVTPDNDALVKIAAMKLGGEFAKKNPGEVEKVLLYAEALEQGQLTTDMFVLAKSYLYAKVKDPVDVACLDQLMTMVVVQEDKTQIDIEQFGVALDGFVFGMKVAGGVK